MRGWCLSSGPCWFCRERVDEVEQHNAEVAAATVLPARSPQQWKKSPGMLLPSLALLPPGLMLLQHRYLRRAQVCVPHLTACPYRDIMN